MSQIQKRLEQLPKKRNENINLAIFRKVFHLTVMLVTILECWWQNFDVRDICCLSVLIISRGYWWPKWPVVTNTFRHQRPSSTSMLPFFHYIFGWDLEVRRSLTKNDHFTIKSKSNIDIISTLLVLEFFDAYETALLFWRLGQTLIQRCSCQVRSGPGQLIQSACFTRSAPARE